MENLPSMKPLALILTVILVIYWLYRMYGLYKEYKIAIEEMKTIHKLERTLFYQKFFHRPVSEFDDIYDNDDIDYNDPLDHDNLVEYIENNQN